MPCSDRRVFKNFFLYCKKQICEKNVNLNVFSKTTQDLENLNSLKCILYHFNKPKKLDKIICFDFRSICQQKFSWISSLKIGIWMYKYWIISQKNSRYRCLSMWDILKIVWNYSKFYLELEFWYFEPQLLFIRK